MKKTLEIRGNSISFVANAATPLYYKMFFKKDLLKQLNSGDGIEIAGDNIPELAFIMAKQADKADMMHLKYEQYLQWLEIFDPLDIVMQGAEIIGVYFADMETDVEPKKKANAKAKE